MNIQTVLSGITPYDSVRSYGEFAKIMDNAYIVLSFWGNRNVYAVGYNGSVYLEDVVRKMNDLIDSHPQFNEEERAIGKAIEAKVSSLYRISTDQEKNVGYITKFFMIAIDLFTPIQNQMYDIWLSARSYDKYTSQQYRAAFNSDPIRKKPDSYVVDKDPRKGIPVWWAPQSNDPKI